jgi:hypothetical protein
MLSIALVSTVLPLGQSLRAAGVDVDVEYRDPNEAGDGVQIVVFKDSTPVSGYSYLMNGTAENLCTSLDDEKCAGGGSINYTAIMPPCTSATQLDCIIEFGFANENDDKTPGSFIGTFPTVSRNQFSGDIGRKLPFGGAPNLWNIPSLPHAGGTTYMVQMQSRGFSTGGTFTFTDFGIEVKPVELVPDVCIPNQGSDEACSQNGGPGFYSVPTSAIEYDENGNELPRETMIGMASRVSNTSFDCVIIAQDQCARRHAFPAGARIYIKAKLSQTPRGWMHGRISKPTVTLTSLGGTAVELSISASTVNTPVVAQARRFSALPESLQNAYRATGGFNGGSAGTRNRPTFNSGAEVRNAISQPTSFSSQGMAELLAWIPHINDTATANISTWAVRSLSDGELANATSCFKNTAQLNGLVMTNASQYSAGPPTFDKASGSLEYQVAAPHYTSGGNVFTGTYDLVMRSDVARCLYGFSKAPLNASISVIDNDGVQTAATKLVSEKDGWLRIAAYGFGFSSPKIKVNLSQADTPANKKVAPKKTTNTKKTTITCKKGKAVKKVTALKPLCPKGFKKA